MSEHETLEKLIDELETVASRLRAGDADPQEAAALVEECARLAARVGAELDSSARATEAGNADGQERLL